MKVTKLKLILIYMIYMYFSFESFDISAGTRRESASIIYCLIHKIVLVMRTITNQYME